MLLDSFHIPRVLPPQLAALVALLKTPAAEKRFATGEIDDDARLPLGSGETLRRSGFSLSCRLEGAPFTAVYPSST
jgi:hypothetical protein